MSANILLVDDEPAVLEGFACAMHHESYQILRAQSGREALEILASRPVHVLVADEHMPGMSGVELLLKARSDYPRTVRIMLTGDSSASTALRAIYDGWIYQYLTKPCPATELIATINSAPVEQSLLLDGDGSHLIMPSAAQESLLCRSSHRGE